MPESMKVCLSGRGLTKRLVTQCDVLTRLNNQENRELYTDNNALIVIHISASPFSKKKKNLQVKEHGTNFTAYAPCFIFLRKLYEYIFLGNIDYFSLHAIHIILYTLGK
jgi:hypothetical protein